MLRYDVEVQAAQECDYEYISCAAVRAALCNSLPTVVFVEGNPYRLEVHHIAPCIGEHHMAIAGLKLVPVTSH